MNQTSSQNGAQREKVVLFNHFNEKQNSAKKIIDPQVHYITPAKYQSPHCTDSQVMGAAPYFQV